MSIGTAALVVALAALVVGGFLAVRAWLSWREKRLITCPENERPAAVRVDALKAVAGAMAGESGIRLSECSRWPEMEGCGQECLREIERGPAECLVRTLVDRWYEGKTCVFCGKAIQNVAWADQRPGVRSPDGLVAFWPEVPPETLPDVFRTHAPVCWSCAVVRWVAKERPDVVTLRPPRERLYS